MIQVLLVVLFCAAAFGQTGNSLSEAKAPAVNPDLSLAEQLYQSGNFGGALEKYQSVLKSTPNLVEAQVGVVQCLLREQKIDEASASATSYLASQPNSASLNAVMGDVEFRNARMTESEISYHKALAIDSRQVDAYLGLFRLYRAYSLYGHAYDALQRAHEIAPDNPRVQM